MVPSRSKKTTIFCFWFLSSGVGPGVGVLHDIAPLVEDLVKNLLAETPDGVRQLLIGLEPQSQPLVRILLGTQKSIIMVQNAPGFRGSGELVALNVDEAALIGAVGQSGDETADPVEAAGIGVGAGAAQVLRDLGHLRIDGQGHVKGVGAEAEPLDGGAVGRLSGPDAVDGQQVCPVDTNWPVLAPEAGISVAAVGIVGGALVVGWVSRAPESLHC